MIVYCSHHDKIGTCLREDYNDAKTGLNPSKMVKVHFNNFSQAVPFHTLTEQSDEDQQNENDLNILENQSPEQ